MCANATSFEAITSSFARIRSRSAGLAGARRWGCEQVVRTDDVEALNHQRSVYQTLELLQEAQVLGDRRPGVLDTVGQLDQGHECRAVHHPRRRVAQTLGAHAIKRREQLACRRLGLFDALVLDLLAHHHHAHLVLLPFRRRTAALTPAPVRPVTWLTRGDGWM